MRIKQRITRFLSYVNQAEKAANFYVSVLPIARAVRTLLICIAFFGCLILDENASGIEPAVRDLEYAKVNEHPLKLDLYLPTSEKNSDELLPTIVWVHGGAWRSGSKDDVPIVDFLSQGFCIASVDYRLSPQSQFPAQVHDIKAAIRFLRAHAAEHRLDRERFVIAGASAGGHLAALVGVSAGVKELEGNVGNFLDQDSSVQACVSFYGASNLQTILSQSTEHGLSVRVPALELLLGGQPSAKPALARLASPVAHVDSQDPPLWLIHGEADPQMPLEQSAELADAYRERGLPVSFEVIQGAKHGGDEFYQPQRLTQLAAEIQEHL